MIEQHAPAALAKAAYQMSLLPRIPGLPVWKRTGNTLASTTNKSEHSRNSFPGLFCSRMPSFAPR